MLYIEVIRYVEERVERQVAAAGIEDGRLDLIRILRLQLERIDRHELALPKSAGGSTTLYGTCGVGKRISLVINVGKSAMARIRP